MKRAGTCKTAVATSVVVLLGVGLAPALNAQKSPAQGAGTLKTSTKTIEVTLPTGSVVEFPNKTTRYAAGIETIRRQNGADRLLLTRDRKASYGYALVDGSTYLITTAEGEIRVLPPGNTTAVEADVAAMRGNDIVRDPAVTEQFHQKLLEQGLTRNGPTALDAASSVVDVAFFYDQTMVAAQGEQAPHTQVQAAIDYMNAAYVMHGVPLTIRAVYVGPHPGGTFSFDPLSDIYHSAQVNEIANSFGADLVHALFQNVGQNYCGIGFMPGRHAASAHNCDLNRVIAHEIGHNFAMNHDRANAGGSAVPEVDGFNYGYVCANRGTIMSYPGAPHLPHYSSPTLLNGGVPCGIAEGGTGAAHNAKVLDVTRQTVESHRPTRAIHGTIRLVTPERTTLQEEGGTPIVVEIVRDGDLTESVSVDLAEIAITAQVEADFTRVAKRLVFEANEERKTVVLSAIDDDEYDKDEEFQLVLRYPLGATVIDDTLTFTITDSDLDRGKAQFAQPALSVWESAGTLNLEVKRVGNVANSLKVGYETFALTAVAGTDYETATGELEFQPGESSRTVPVRVNNDALFQGYLTYRQFGVRLSGTGVVAPTSMSVAIFNDDLVSGNGALAKQVIEVSENATQAVLRVSRINGSEGALTVQFKTAAGTAQPGRDYSEVAGAITFQNGVVTAAVVVDVYDNDLFDANREFRIIVTNPDQTTSETIVRIVNDDPDRGRARFETAQVTTREADGSVTLNVAREGVTEGTLTVLYSTAPVTAIPGRDYSTAVGRVVFAPGESSKQIQIVILTDQTQEPAETFRVALFGDVITPDVATVEIAGSASAASSFQVKSTTTAEKRGGGGRMDFVLLALLLTAVVRRHCRAPSALRE
jgi:hypothetical protein